MRIQFLRLVKRLWIYYHGFWWVTYTISIVSICWLGTFYLTGESPDSFQDIFVAIGALAVISIAIRQKKDADASFSSSHIPLVTRNTTKGNFQWGNALWGLNSNRDFSTLLGIQIMGEMHVTNLKGYILHEGYLYPIKFGPKEPSIDSGSARIEVNQSQTWARKQFLYLIPDIEKKRKVKYPGNYYCVTFMTPLGARYFLEENHKYEMSLRMLDRARPKWNTDYLFEFILE